MFKRMFVFLMMVLLITGCTETSGTSGLNQDEEIGALQEEIARLKADLDALTEAYENNKAALDEAMEANDILAADNGNLEEEIVTLTHQLSEYASTNQPPSLVAMAQTVMMLIKNQDFQALSAYVDPVQGTRFSPYPYVDVANDLVLMPSEVLNFPLDSALYTWGSYDGSGEPILMGKMAYYDAFIYDHDYAVPELMSLNAPIGTGNMINNLASVYPMAEYVEFYFSGFDPQYQGMDWSGLTLVFEETGGQWYLVGIVHGQWTI